MRLLPAWLHPAQGIKPSLTLLVITLNTKCNLIILNVDGHQSYGLFVAQGYQVGANGRPLLVSRRV